MAEESTDKPTRRNERIGKYEILGHIAKGGMGVIYKARDADLDRLVALKVLSADLGIDAMTLERFRREAKAAARLRHENIVTLYDVGESKGVYYIALEYIEGIDLQEYINRKCQLDPEDARQIIIQAARALRHAHEHGIVHRDIKPSNFLLAKQGKRLIVKLTDFGLAMRHDNDAEFRITKDKTTVGTVDYLSPEQARNSRSADIRSDIYSLGCTYFHLLAGTAPFAKGTMPERLVHHMKTPTPDVRKLSKNAPAYVTTIINRMLAKKPADRYQTPTDLLRDLEHPEQIVVTDGKPGPAVGKLERAAPSKSGADAAGFTETKELDRYSATPRQVKTSKPRKAPTSDSMDEIAKPTDRAASAAQEDSEDFDDSGAYELSKEFDLPKNYDSVRDADAAPKQEKTRDYDDSREFEDSRRLGDTPDYESSQELESADAEEDADEEKPAKSSGAPVWIYATAGAVGVLAIVMIIALTFGNRPPQVKVASEPPKPPDKEWPKDPEDAPAPVEIPKKIEPKIIVAIDTSPEKMNAGALPWPIMDTPPAKADRAALHKEYYGPFTSIPKPPKDALVLRMSRLAPIGPESFRTLAEALANSKADSFTVIEIHDNGPIHVPALPPLAQRSILLRAGTGYRPLLIWEVSKPAGDEKPTTSFAALTGGKLIVEHLDFIVDWPLDAPATLFDLPGADFYARGCTFTTAGKTGPGVTIVRRQEKLAKESRKTQTWLQRCYVRGLDMTLLNLNSASTDVLIEESLVVGYQQPLLQIRGRDEEAVALHCVRSSLVTGQVLLHWQALDGKGGRPRIDCRVLDSILSRDDTTAPLGDMIHLAGKADPARMSWRSANCVYAGWKQLLTSGRKTIAGGDDVNWRKQWNYRDGDRVMLDTWPLNPPPELEEQPPSTFLPAPSPVAFAALTDTAAIGCVIGRLPPTPEGWKDTVYKPGTVPVIPSADLKPPEIDKSTTDKLYHGERLNLDTIDDLGIKLSDLLSQKPAAPDVVMHLYGKGGPYQISNLRVKGVKHLVLYFEQTKDPKDALTLEGKPTNALDPAPVIEMTGGHLELIGARIRLSNVTIIPTILHVQGGQVTLTRCLLQGPLNGGNESCKSLVRVGNTGPVPTTLLLRDSVLVSGKGLIHLTDHVQLKARNNLFVSLGDGVQIDLNRPTIAMTHVLDHNTWAVRQHLFGLWTGPEFQGDGNAVVHAKSNAFLYPFADEPERRAFLGGKPAPVERGCWNWMGNQNVFDTRLNVYVAGAEMVAPPKQTLRDWRYLWGQLGEVEAYPLDLGPAGKTLDIEKWTPATLNSQLERLVLPRTVPRDPNQAPPGADLVSLGILKKKG